MDLLINILLVVKPVLGILLLVFLVLAGCKYFGVEDIPYWKLISGSTVVAFLTSIAMLFNSAIIQPTTQVHDKVEELVNLEYEQGKEELVDLATLKSKEVTTSVEDLKAKADEKFKKEQAKLDAFFAN